MQAELSNKVREICEERERKYGQEENVQQEEVFWL
jgi:hypothetical protein